MKHEKRTRANVAEESEKTFLCLNYKKMNETKEAEKILFCCCEVGKYRVINDH